jgi:hypothetical protein
MSDEFPKGLPPLITHPSSLLTRKQTGPEIERSFTMTGGYGKRFRRLLLPLLLCATTTAWADQKASYTVRGPAGAALWGVGEQPGTEALVFAFDNLTPEKGNTPAPGPRVAFSVTQWSLESTGWVRRQWYGDAALPEAALAITPALTEGTLDVTVSGTLEERRESGVLLHREVPGRVQIRWTAQGALGQNATAYNYQTPAYATTLKTTGSGRGALATASVTVDALGGRIELLGLGSLAAVSKGQLTVTME